MLFFPGYTRVVDRAEQGDNTGLLRTRFKINTPQRGNGNCGRHDNLRENAQGRLPFIRPRHVTGQHQYARHDYLPDHDGWPIGFGQQACVEHSEHGENNCRVPANAPAPGQFKERCERVSEERGQRYTESIPRGRLKQRSGKRNKSSMNRRPQAPRKAPGACASPCQGL